MRTTLLLLCVQAEVAHELAARKCFLQGCDAQGHPVLVVWAARHDMGDRRMEETKRFICYCLDNTIAAADATRNPGAQIKCLFDLSGARPGHYLHSLVASAGHPCKYCQAGPACQSIGQLEHRLSVLCGGLS